jgi:hypothetical protein
VDDPSPDRPDVERAVEPEDETDRPLPLYSRMRRASEEAEPFVERLRLEVPLLPSDRRRVEDEPAAPLRVEDWDLIKPPCEFPPEE